MRRRQWLSAVLSAVFVLSPTAGIAEGRSAAGPATNEALSSRTERSWLDAPAVGTARDASGIALVGDSPIQVQGLNDQQAMAFDAALNLAMDHRDVLGYPWVEPDTGTLDLAAADAKGTAILVSAKATAAISAVPTRVTTAQASMAKLDEIADAVTRLNAQGVPDAGLIYRTEPDQRDNLIVITVSSLSETLMTALASKFGTSLIAVRVRPLDDWVASSNSRASDAPAFWGGAKIFVPVGYCTTGFAWAVGSVSAMLTAAHCAPSGGNISYTNYPNAGSVHSATEENWNTTYGTQYYTGQSTYRGDVALIRYTSAYSSAGRIYDGSQTSTHSAAVWGMNPRRAQVGDAICDDGITTGEWCGAVLATGSNILYLLDGPNVWARNVDEGYALGNTCPTHGDSGSGVYQKRADGKVTAFGIQSGSAPLVLDCHIFFTDIWDAYYGLPGTLKTG